VEHGDDQLVARARDGDRGAYQTLVEHYQRRILSVVIGMVRNPDDAQEIVQETFIRAFRNLGGFKGDSSFFTWLYRIAVNLSIDFQRKNSKRTTVELDESVPPVAEPSAFGGGGRGSQDPFERVRDKELVGKVFKAMEALTPDHQAVILLREVEGLSYEEISEALDCSMGTVMSRLHYARKKLQSRLSELL
jgi:RNA polymerase sigma-70 factor (ECF subfamily)